ncbi:MAG: SufE family protein [Bdellovibrionales bacterium]|jgi:cysteine desulfuration protein SufE|nr:SufE family protein [Bdellovibrionales bacterium]MBT3527490.1 SufE family protein [Bdellovibrionales bacterium]MBT7765521.1 SufE family protein [Bdellovibrionales bacterium]
MAIEQRVAALMESFSGVQQWEERYRMIIKMGRQMPEFPGELRLEENTIKGCQSQVWLHTEFTDGVISFHADSDAAISKGIVAMLLSVYSGSTPEEILRVGTGFLDQLGVRDHLSMSRSNGLSAMLKQISIYAVAYQAMAKNS